MTWGSDGRALFRYGDAKRPGERHVIWHRVGTHDIFDVLIARGLNRVMADMMKAENLTPERINALLRFLPRFEMPGRAFVERWGGGEQTATGAITMPYPVYTPDVKEFFRIASEPWWCDNEYDPADAAEMIQNDSLIRRATVQQLKTMLTFCVRGERFSDGHWDAVLRSGRVVALLRRLEILRTTIEQSSG